MKRRSAIHHLSHIASLGLGDRLAVPLMLDVLAEIMPAMFLNFIWLDENERPCDIWLPKFMREPLRVYLEGCDRLDPAREPTIRSVVSAGLTVGANERWNRRSDFPDTVLYNETLRPYGIGAGLDLVLRRDGRALGILFVNRERQFSRFTEDERRLLITLEPLFLRALAAPAELPQHADEPIDRAVMLLSGAGEILFASEAASLLAHQLLDDTMVRWCDASWRQAIVRLVRDGEARHATPWGTLVAQAMPPGPETLDAGLSAVMLERRVPREVAILARLRETSLSPREREVAFALATQPSDAPRRLGLTQATWRDYQKRIYAKLGVHSRVELTGRLVSGPTVDGRRRAAWRPSLPGFGGGGAIQVRAA